MQIVLQIEGMTCAHCAMTITKVLERNGAKNPSVNFATGEARFFLENKNELGKIINEIHHAGYKVVSQNEDKNNSGGFSSVEKRFFFTLPFTLPLFFSHLVFPHNFIPNHPLVQFILCLPVFVTGCLYFGKSAWNSLKSKAPNMDVLIMLGSGAAFVYSVIGTFLYYGTHQVHDYIFYETAATIITLVLLGNVMEHRSVKQTTSAIGEMTKLQTLTAKKIIPSTRDGQEKIQEIPVKEILTGDIFLVNTGDKIPADGIILSGEILADESMITGESMPAEKYPGTQVIGGTIVVNGNMRMRAERVGQETVLSKIIELVKNAQQSKPRIQKLGDKVSGIFVPAVLGIAVLTFLICHFVFNISIQQSLMNSIAVLVISCPCAMGLATPTAVMVGIGRAAKNGILIKGGSTLEEFAKVKKIAFDKTGTLTTGKFKIKNIQALNGISRQEVESVLFHLEQHSSHPLAKSIVSELKNRNHSAISFSEIKEVKGTGIEAKDKEGNVYKVGSYRIASGITADNSHTLYVLKNEALAGVVDMEDEIKQQAKETISFLKSRKVLPVLLSGDTRERCEVLASRLGIEEVHSEQLPEQKINLLNEFSEKTKVAMVGDGINDAPALAKASVGISIGNATQVAIHSSQIILLNEKDLMQLKTAYLLSRHTLLTIKQNLFWAFFYNVIAIPVAAAGFLNPMIGALSMAFSDVMVIGNSIRLRTKKLE